MKHGTYIGPDVGWNITKGDTALLRDSPKPGVILAQFDDFSKARSGVDQSHGWHEYPANHFEIDPDVNFEVLSDYRPGPNEV